jgi:hypothetical protein
MARIEIKGQLAIVWTKVGGEPGFNEMGRNSAHRGSLTSSSSKNLLALLFT